MAIDAGNVYSELVLDTNDFYTKMNDAEKRADTFGSNLQKTGKKIESTGKGLTAGLTVPIVGGLTLATRASIDFESSFAGVRKTVDATEEEFAMLEKGIKDMSSEIPASASAIASVGEAAGQLGIQTENILDFTRVMIDLGESTNLSADEAATALARFANITQMSQGDFDKLGSVIVDLGNNLATTEAEIVEMGLRLAGAGKQIGLSEAEVLSLAGGLSSVGIQAEAGGSAFSKLMVNMQLATETGTTANKVIDSTGMSLRDLELYADINGKGFKGLAQSMGLTSEELKSYMSTAKDLESFAAVTGKSGDEFAKSFGENAVGAIGEFIEGLASAEDRGLSAIAILDEMGITEVRLRDSLLRAAGASEVFSNAVDIGSNAWEENNALTKEAEQRYKTTASQLGIAKNTLTEAGMVMGDIVVPYLIEMGQGLKNAANWFKELNPETQDTIVKMLALTAAIGPTLIMVGKLSRGIGSTVNLVAKLSGGAGLAATKVGVGASGLGGALTGSLAAIAPWGLAIAGAGAAAYTLYKHLNEETIPEVDLFGDSVSENTKIAVTGFLDLERDATTALNQLKWSGTTVTSEMASEIGLNINGMKQEIVSTLQDQKIEAVKEIEEMFKDSVGISEEEKADMIRIATEKYDSMIDEAERGADRIKEILEIAKEENRKISEDEYNEIIEIKENMKEDGVRLLSETEIESLAILERLKAQSGEITADMAAEVVRNSLSQKEQAISNAEEEYNERLKFAATLRSEGTEEAIALANKVVEEAKRQRDDSVSAAEEMHKKVVEEAKNQAKEHVEQINWETGEIKTQWAATRDWFAKNPIIQTIMSVFKDDKSQLQAERNDRTNPMGSITGKNALGTDFWEGGRTWVGEHGPEIIELPRGSKVFSNNDSINSTQKVEHGGVIRIEGVNEKNQVMAVVDIILDQLRKEVR